MEGFGLFAVCSLLEHCTLKLRSALINAVWSRKQPLAHGSSVLSLLDGTDGCDPGLRFRVVRRYLACHSDQIQRIE